MSQDFVPKIAKINQAMLQEEWGKAMQLLENLGTIPPQFSATISNLLFQLYVSRNQYPKLARIAEQLDPEKPKDGLISLLLFRNLKIGYQVILPKERSLDIWENAIKKHLAAATLDTKDLPTYLHLLASLNRPKLLHGLFRRYMEEGGNLDNDLIETILRCYLAHGWFQAARDLIWANTINDLAVSRFLFLIDRAENPSTPIPVSRDKFLNFLRLKFGLIPTNLFLS